MDQISEPLYYPGVLLNWKTFQKWSLEYLIEIFKSDVKFKVGKCVENCSEIKDQSEIVEVKCSFKSFADWCNGLSSKDLLEYDTREYYAYCSYEYAHQLFANNQKLLDDIDWTFFGLEAEKKSDTVFWLGSGGSFTNCHYDTYGCNLICQLRGRKTWLLFPPDDIDHLYPTRMPYEESSVYSKIDFRTINLDRHSRLGQTRPRKVTLGPGDALWLPRHWWHFVRTDPQEIGDDEDQYSLAVNLWLDDDIADRSSRAREALVRLAVYSYTEAGLMVPSTLTSLEDRQELLETDWQRNYVSCLGGLLGQQHDTKEKSWPTQLTMPGDGIGQSLPMRRPHEIFLMSESAGSATVDDVSAPEVSTRDVLNAFLHPRVIDTVLSVLADTVLKE